MTISGWKLKYIKETEEFKKFIINNDYYGLYNWIYENYTWDSKFGGLTTNLTISLSKAGVNPLNYLRSIPSYFLIDVDLFKTGIGEQEELVIPGTVKTIESNAFASIANLKTIWIQEGVSELKPYCFDNIVDLDAIYLPKSLKSFAPDALSRVAGFDIYFEGTRQKAEEFFSHLINKRYLSINVFYREHGDWIEYVG